MSIKLNKEAFKHAQNLIRHGEVEKTKIFKWAENKPNRDSETRFLETHNDSEYGTWFLGVDSEAKGNAMKQYLYPIGDLNVVYKEGLVAAHNEAQAEGHDEIARATQQLIDMIDSQEH